MSRAFTPSVAASRMIAADEWMFTRTTEAQQPVNGTRCEIIGLRDGYDAYDVIGIVDWLADRAAGYPSLRKFAGGANWPTMDYCSACEGATGYHRADTWNH